MITTYFHWMPPPQEREQEVQGLYSTTERVMNETPPPQFSEHLPQLDQSEYLQSSGQK